MQSLSKRWKALTLVLIFEGTYNWLKSKFFDNPLQNQRFYQDIFWQIARPMLLENDEDIWPQLLGGLHALL